MDSNSLISWFQDIMAVDLKNVSLEARKSMRIFNSCGTGDSKAKWDPLFKSGEHCEAILATGIKHGLPEGVKAEVNIPKYSEQILTVSLS